MRFINPASIGHYLFLEELSNTSPYFVYRTVDLSKNKFTSFKSFKTLNPKFIKDKTVIRELKNEYQSLKQLKHKNITHYYESGKISGQPFYSYDYIWGRSLLQVFRELRKFEKILSQQYALFITAEVCKALSYATSVKSKANPKGILHLNLNPHNILISYSGEVSIVGFGHKQPQLDLNNLSQYDFRKISCLSPEQINSGEVSSSSDIFAVGCMLYEMLTGAPAFLEKSQIKVINRISKCSYIPASKINITVPPYIDEIISGCLTPYIDDRFSSISVLQEEICSLLDKKYPDFSSNEISALMRTLFKKTIVTDIKYFNNLFAKIDHPKKKLLNSIPKIMFKNLQGFDKSNTGETGKVIVDKGLSENIKHPQKKPDDEPEVIVEQPNSIVEIPRTKTLSSGSSGEIAPESDFFESEDSVLVDFNRNVANVKKRRASGSQNVAKQPVSTNVLDFSQAGPDLNKTKVAKEAYAENLPDFNDDPTEIDKENPFVEEPPKEIAGTTGQREQFIGKQFGEYMVTGILGWGGMGTVYEGIHPLIGKEVAIKVLKAGFIKNREITQRFLAEAKAVNSIKHPNIIDIFSYGIFEDQYHYFVMEKLSGITLSEYLKTHETVPFDVAYQILVQVFSAMEEAHKNGIIHRDLKPDNIFLERRALVSFYVKILDFGIAKFTQDGFKTSITKDGVAIGSPYYMSPEQCVGRGISTSSDIYSIGVILYEMFTGKLPFNKKSYLEMLLAHVKDEPPAPSSVKPMDSELEDIILWTLNKNKKDRPESIEQLRKYLFDYLKSKV